MMNENNILKYLESKSFEQKELINLFDDLNRIKNDLNNRNDILNECYSIIDIEMNKINE